MFLIGLIVYVISAVAFPIWYIALGEDIGWQGYMFPLLCKKMSVKCAAIIHGPANIIGEVGTWISLSTKSSLFGPAPTGIIGLSVFLVGAVILFFMMPSNVEK